MARPARIALAAAPRSLPRSAIVIPGAAAIVWMNSRDVAVLSISTATTSSPRTTAELNVKPEHRKGDDRHAEQQEARHGVAQDPAHLARRDSQPARAAAASRAPLGPVRVDAHPRPQSGDRLRRIGADLERPQVEVTARPRRAPAGVFALGARSRGPPARRCDRRAPAPARRTSSLALRSRSRSSRRSNCTHMSAGIDQRDQRHARQHELAVLDRDAEHLAVGRRNDDHLIDQRLERLDIGLGAFDLGQRDVQVLAGEACHRLVVGEACLVQRTFSQRQCGPVLVELRLRRIVRGDELPCPIEGLLRQRQVGARPARPPPCAPRSSLPGTPPGRAPVRLRPRAAQPRSARSLAISSGLSMRISGAPACTSCERATTICPMRPSTRAAMSKVRDCTSPWMTSGSRRVRYQSDSPIITTNSTATISTAGAGRRARWTVAISVVGRGDGTSNVNFIRSASGHQDSL